jgi:rhamnose transport system permease protein
MRRLLQRRELVLAGIIVLLVVGVTVRAPVFLSPVSLDTLITDGAILAMMALAQMLALLTGGIELSIPANMALVGMITALLSGAHPETPVVAFVVLALGLGLLLGSLNAALIAGLGMPPIVVTLATMIMYRGMVFYAPLLFGGKRGAWVNAHEFSKGYLAFPTARTFLFTNMVWIAAAAIVLGYLFLAHTRRGREIYALGGNPSAARYVGIAEGKVLFLVYAVIGLMSGLAGYLWVARYAIAYTETAVGFELQTVAACVIGGVSTSGGKGSVLGCLLGAVFLVIIFNALPIINVSPFWQMGITGAVILAAVVINSRSERSSGKVILQRAATREPA